MSCFWIRPIIVDSETVMCSATSATDQRSGAGLNVHCFCESPEIDLRKLSRVVSNCFRANSRSSDVRAVEAAGAVCALAEPSATQTMARKTSGASYGCGLRTKDAERLCK